MDLRPDSPPPQQHLAIELTEENRSMLYFPGSFAHGFQTLQGDTEALYQMFHISCPGLRARPAVERSGTRYFLAHA